MANTPRTCFLTAAQDKCRVLLPPRYQHCVVSDNWGCLFLFEVNIIMVWLCPPNQRIVLLFWVARNNVFTYQFSKDLFCMRKSITKISYYLCSFICECERELNGVSPISAPRRCPPHKTSMTEHLLINEPTVVLTIWFMEAFKFQQYWAMQVKWLHFYFFSIDWNLSTHQAFSKKSWGWSVVWFLSYSQ